MKIEIIPAFLGKHHSSKTKSKISISILKHISENGPNKGIRLWKHSQYKGYWCDSSWELAYVIYNLAQNIKFKRNYPGFTYIFNNKLRKFYPDFILEDRNICRN